MLISKAFVMGNPAPTWKGPSAGATGLVIAQQGTSPLESSVEHPKPTTIEGRERPGAWSPQHGPLERVSSHGRPGVWFGVLLLRFRAAVRTASGWVPQ